LFPSRWTQFSWKKVKMSSCHVYFSFASLCMLTLSLSSTSATSSPPSSLRVTGGWCRPSNGVQLKPYFEYEKDLNPWYPNIASAEECRDVCWANLGTNLACSQYTYGECYCTVLENDANIATDFCFSKMPGSVSYVVGLSTTPQDCGSGYDCCDCSKASSSIADDNCGSWDLNYETKLCSDRAEYIPVPTGQLCVGGLGEIHTCCRICPDPNNTSDQEFSQCDEMVPDDNSALMSELLVYLGIGCCFCTLFWCTFGFFICNQKKRRRFESGTVHGPAQITGKDMVHQPPTVAGQYMVHIPQQQTQHIPSSFVTTASLPVAVAVTESSSSC